MQHPFLLIRWGIRPLRSPIIADGRNSARQSFELFRRLTSVPACALARQAGCAQIELVTNQRRAGAHRFYQREGMHSTHYGFTLPL